MSTDYLRNSLAELEAELDDIYTMSEEAACFRYNVDTKNEAIEILKERINEAYIELDEAKEKLLDPDAEHEIGMLDPAFRALGDFYRMRA
jgi:hypothetical protein